MRKTRFHVLLVAMLCLSAIPTATAQESPEFGDDLALLAQSMARLADTLERQERSRERNGGIERLRVLVSLLDIRAQKYEALQRELRQREDQEQRTLEAIETNRSRLERLEGMLDDPELVNGESMEEDLKRQRSELEIRVASLETRLQYASGRQIEIENRIAEQEQLVRELDGLIESWLSETDVTPRKR